MIRGKLETTDTGAGSPVAVTTATSFQNASTDSRFTEAFERASGNDLREYVILDANGTAWEYGLGYQSLTNFYRDTVIESTNADAAISLSVGTHTILFPAGGLAGRFASQRFNGSASPAIGGYANFSWTTVNNSVDNANDLPGGSAVSLPSTFPIGNGVPYFKGWQAHITVVQDTATTGNWINVYGVNNNIYGTIDFSLVMPTDNINFYQSVSSPLMSTLAPIGSGPTYGGSPGDWQFTVYNPGAARTVDAVLQVDYFL